MVVIFSSSYFLSTVNTAFAFVSIVIGTMRKIQCVKIDLLSTRCVQAKNFLLYAIVTIVQFDLTSSEAKLVYTLI